MLQQSALAASNAFLTKQNVILIVIYRHMSDVTDTHIQWGASYLICTSLAVLV